MLRNRLFAWHLELRNVHRRLEKALEEARDALREGDRAAVLKPELLQFCYTFCSALGTHHRSEDAAFFPALLKQNPALEPIITALTREHEGLSRLLTDFQRALDSADSTPQELFQQLNEIKGAMKAHFGFEEGALKRALRDLDAPESDKRRMFGDV
ncbi:hemerythrin domain-containing protein [Nonomuraea pusilla]|uniref:Hemerythrin HHE cation binding domain-containing protein n=1 Tax=Nonomuraea pusilla TaxID=46177 RepID=A0A1H8CAX5_9ACTN|nr:hemerythrin domain-containing protein [Nonomuraea pusilla]SEM92243.1 Hemerythrin HHE cation binding domain-containing protein [Nonomuraea pusilla]